MNEHANIDAAGIVEFITTYGADEPFTLDLVQRRVELNGEMLAVLADKCGEFPYDEALAMFAHRMRVASMDVIALARDMRLADQAVADAAEQFIMRPDA